jgi:hypothetical protein
MSTQLFILGVIGIVVVTYAAIAVTSWIRMRGTRVVTCPETRHSAAVEVDAEHAALTSLFEKPDIRLKSCSRWPDRKDCNQPCVAQIKDAPHDTLASTIIADYFAGKRCSVCTRAIPPVHPNEPKPGLLEPSTGRLLTWADIKPEDLPDALKAFQPVCENCMVVETFRREYPDMVTERPTRAPIMHKH